MYQGSGGGFRHYNIPVYTACMRIPAMSLGDKCGEYRLIRKLGEGGIGTVWLAHDPGLDRQVAIKSLRPEYEKNSVLARRFIREAKATARLSHPNIVTIYQIGHALSGQPYFVMEFLDSGSLADKVRATHGLQWPLACRYAAQAARGLAVAHKSGIIHRDVKPANIMLTSSGAIKVVDFGLAHADTIDPEITHPGAFLGSPSYVSPEQAAGAKPTPASDIYALGITLYVLLTGKPPFANDDAAVVLEQHKMAPFPDIRKIAPHVPQELANVISTMAAKKAEDRPASMTKVEQTLLAIASAAAAAVAPAIVPKTEPVIASAKQQTAKKSAAPRKKTTFKITVYEPDVAMYPPVDDTDMPPEEPAPAIANEPPTADMIAQADQRVRVLSQQVEQSRVSGDSATELDGWRKLFDEYSRIGREDDARLAAKRAVAIYAAMHHSGVN